MLLLYLNCTVSFENDKVWRVGKPKLFDISNNQTLSLKSSVDPSQFCWP